jgi:peptidoglycan/xylan/chitin deacetylase (PgdA/CDA1 family)
MYAHDHRIPSSSIVGVMAAISAASYFLPALAGRWAPLRGPLGVEDHTVSGQGVAITFDDGPHVRGTPLVLEELARRGIPATFFLVGEQVQRNPALAAEIVAAGHGVGLHCYRHRNLLRLTAAQVNDDHLRALAIIEDATSSSVTLYRPPYGALSWPALALARRRGWRTLLWSQWGRDWERRATADSITRHVTRGVGQGSVLLLHDADDYSAPGSWQRTVKALPLVLDVLQQRGLQAVLA